MKQSSNNDNASRSEGDVNTSRHRKAWLEDHIDGSTRELLARDEKVFIRQSLSTPCLNALESVDGIYLVDLQGRRFMDFHGNSVHQVGYGHPKVIEAVKRQLDSLPFCPRRYTNETAVLLAEKLCALAPESLDKCLLAPGGTSAIGMALKLVRYVTGRHKTLSMWDAFHGASLDAISIGGEALFRRGVGPLLTGTEHVPPPSWGHKHFESMEKAEAFWAEYIDYVLRTQGDVGAIIAEPMRWTTVEPPSAAFWRSVRDACDRHGALLVFDEIPSALGRSGRMFVCQTIDVTPDILVIGKGLGGAVFPMAAMLTRGEYDQMNEVALGHYTHEKSPVGCAAALATLEVIEDEGLMEHAVRMGERALQRMHRMKARYPIISGVRGLGLHLGIELGTASGPALDAAEQVLYHSLAHGLSYKLGAGCVITLCPPLTITPEQLDTALDIVESGISSL
jgi:4-aminobutyrate aminotransferase